MSEKGAEKVVKDAGTGRFVSREHAAKNPGTTYVQTVKRETKKAGGKKK